MALVLNRFGDADALEAALCATVAGQLRLGIASRGEASMVVSGGRTPHGLFARLAATRLAWDRVTITLADERWVAADHPDSNERAVRARLLRGEAATARFIPLFNGAPEPWAGLERAHAALAQLRRPFDVVMLGMGEDGHTASLFPSAGRLAAPSAVATPDCIGVRPATAPHDRVSLTAAALLDTCLITLHFTGSGKWPVLCEALKPGAVDALPIRAVVQQDEVPCHVFWTR